jgi:hypothetical protein
MIPPLPGPRFPPASLASRPRDPGDRFNCMERGAPDAPVLLPWLRSAWHEPWFGSVTTRSEVAAAHMSRETPWY